jgi:hypothetical protein
MGALYTFQSINFELRISKSYHLPCEYLDSQRHLIEPLEAYSGARVQSTDRVASRRGSYGSDLTLSEI